MLTCCGTIPASAWCVPERAPPRHGVISVRLQSPPESKKTVTYAQASAEEGRRRQSAGVQRIGPDGSASFVVTMGTEYDIGIFADLNHSQAPDPNDPGATAGRLIPTQPAFGVMPITLAFGCGGSVSAPDLIPPLTSSRAPATSDSSIRAAAVPYMDGLPLWLREQIAR